MNQFLRRIAGFLFGCAYSFVYLMGAIFATGGGHGNFFWLAAPSYPPIYGIAIFIVFGTLAADLRSNVAKIILGILLFFHYAYGIGVLVFYPDLRRDAWFFFGRDAMIYIYFFGQILIWAALIQSIVKFDLFGKDRDLNPVRLN